MSKIDPDKKAPTWFVILFGMIAFFILFKACEFYNEEYERTWGTDEKHYRINREYDEYKKQQVESKRKFYESKRQRNLNKQNNP